ncbi:MAG TPA: DinB family protein [Granulicella sp.]|jgi:uncharacterized damage-inducible protein DinB|nr:DinB family protein [Granulicella sp.]
MNPLTALSAEELIAWNDTTARRWHAFFSANPAALALPCDIHATPTDPHTVAHFLQHIVAAQLRHAQRLAGQLIDDYDAIPGLTPDDFLISHDRTLTLLRSLLADPTIDWAGPMEFQTLTAGRRRSSRRTLLFHSMLHGIRHYAQLATLIRQAGYTPNIPGDYLLMDAHPA